VEPASSFLAGLYPEALPEVYGYLLHRVRDARKAEDLASETFLQAVRSLRDGTIGQVTTPWLITVARHKLVDHWRREATAGRAMSSAAAQADERGALNEWDARLDRLRAEEVLGRLTAQNRAALTLRYLDGLKVAEVAALLGRTVHATEALLVRARVAFRRSYEEHGGDGDD
jgi:RNA polymerase sigma-70 factor (ECF subfamily)